MSVTDIGVDLPASPTLLATATAFVCVIGTASIGAMLPASRAARVPALEALPGRDELRRKLRVRRLVAAGVIVALAIFCAVGAIGERYNGSASSLVVLSGCALLVTVAVLGAWLLPILVRGWTALVPPASSASWFVARTGALSRMTATTATITPFMIGAGLLSIYFSAASTWERAAHQGAEQAQLNLLQGLVLFTPAAVIAITGSVVTVSMVGRSREVEVALFRSAGAPPLAMLVLPVLEALIYAVTAFLLAIAASAVSVAVYGVFLVNQGYAFEPVLDLRAGGLVSLVGFVGVAIAIGVPSWMASRSSISRALQDS